MFDQSQSQSESDNHLSVIMLSPWLVIRIILLSFATTIANCENEADGNLNRCQRNCCDTAGLDGIDLFLEIDLIGFSLWFFSG